MAKDPAFLFYDGDAARDVSHMNRLERGAYFDLIQAQRKFGGYTVEQARKILGKDFDEVWSALELVLSKSDDKYFIEWVQNSIENRKEHAEKQRKRIQDYWDKKKREEQEEVNSDTIPRNNHGITTVVPLENENENENESIYESIKKGGVGGKGEGGEEEPIVEIYPFDDFWDDYEKKVGDKDKLRGKWAKVCNRDRLLIKDYIPRYISAQPNKKYRKNPETFLNQKSWNDEIIEDNNKTNFGKNDKNSTKTVQTKQVNGKWSR